jgi:DNA-binding MarR family transcriptional regulator
MTTVYNFVDDYLAYLLARSSHLMSEQFHRQVLAQGWSINYWRVLASLTDGDGLTLTQLNERVLFKQPTLSKLVGRMEKEKLLIRAKDGADKRTIKIFISPQGQTLVADLLAQAKAHEAKVLADYSEEQQQLLKSMLRSLIVHLKE